MTVENVRLSRPIAMRIEREQSQSTARVFINDQDVSHHVSEVTWTMRAGGLPTATVTFHDVDIDAGAENGPEGFAGLVDIRPHGPLPVTADDWERLRELAPDAVAAIEQARPVVVRNKAVPR